MATLAPKAGRGAPPLSTVENRAVVIPFGVPDGARGLGLGVAALVHGFTQISGHSVALAQLHARAAAGEPAVAPTPVEAFIAPKAWQDLAGAGNAPTDVTVVLTGVIEPPFDGAGQLHLLAFDPRDGATRARVEVTFDPDGAGASIVSAFEELSKSVGAELGMLPELRDLGWDAIESVLYAERCALHDPSRGGPYDQLAAMVHLGRAVGEAPTCRFAAGRLAALALEAAVTSAPDAKITQSALRALERATDDAPTQLELVEAMAALEIRAGRAPCAERRMNAAIVIEPRRARLYALLAESLRVQKNLSAALAAVQAGLDSAGADVALIAERGTVLAEQGDVGEAMACWWGVLEREPHHLPVFANLAGAAARERDPVLAERLVDHALASVSAAPAELLRRAIHIALTVEPDGLSRASRVARLARAVVARAPDDPWAMLILARALAQLGEREEAVACLTQIERMAPGTPIAAEAQRGILALNEPAAAAELDSVLRAACEAPVGDLDAVAARGRRLAVRHRAWMGWLAAGIAHRRASRPLQAREALESALEVAPGCNPAHVELAALALSRDDTVEALRQVQRALALDPRDEMALELRRAIDGRAERPGGGGAGLWSRVESAIRGWMSR